MVEYVKAHWRGELSLARSYWVNTFLLSILLRAAIALIEEPLSRLAIQTILITALGSVVLFTVVAVWQLVGLWRSATNTKQKSSKRFWPGVVKFLVILGILGNTSSILTTTRDLFKMIAAIQHPDVANYVVRREGDTDLILVGAINDRSVDNVIDALNDPLITVFRINSQGGLIEPAIRLARHIRDNDVFVMGEGQCNSACVWMLAASPNAAIYPGTEVTFHRAEALVEEYSNPDIRDESRRYLSEVQDYDIEFGIPNWVTEKTNQQLLWTPTIEEQIFMGLISLVYDTDLGEFVAAYDYCTRHKTECTERQESAWVTEARHKSNEQNPDSGKPDHYETESGDINTELGSDRLENGLYDEALEYFNKALQEAPDHRGALMGRSLVFIQTERYEEAIAELDYLIEFLDRTLEPDDETGRGVLAAAFANRGIVYDRLDNHRKALDNYVEALNIDENVAKARGSGQVSSVRDRARYIHEQLQLPEDERVLRIPELDTKQPRHKP